MNARSPRVSTVCVVYTILPDPFGDVGETAIDKRAVAGPVEVGPLGLAGDTQCDRSVHGGPDQAVYAYADEDAGWWAAQLGRAIPPGLFGENLRTSGLDITGAEIGERWRIGADLVVEVTFPRQPCQTFAGRMGEPHWVRRFTEYGAFGAYLRVVAPGPVIAGDSLVVERRPGHAVRVGDVFPRRDPVVMRRLLDAADAGLFEIASKMRLVAERAAARA